MGATLRRGLLVLLVLFSVSPGDVEGITSTRRYSSHQEIFPTALRYRLQLLRCLAVSQHEATQVLPARLTRELLEPSAPFDAAQAPSTTNLLYLLMSLQL